MPRCIRSRPSTLTRRLPAAVVVLAVALGATMPTEPTAAAATPSPFDPAVLSAQANATMAAHPAPGIKTGVSVVVPTSPASLLGTVLDDPMYLPSMQVADGVEAGWDVFMTVDSAAAVPGKGEIDLHQGSPESDNWRISLFRRQEDYGDELGDLFILGDERTSYYAGRSSAAEPESDFVYIYRFDPKYAVLRLNGRAEDYVLAPARNPAFLGTDGVALFRKRNGFADMIAFIEGLPANFNLRGPRVQYAKAPSPTPAIPGVDQIGGPGVAAAGLITTDPQGNRYVGVGGCTPGTAGVTGTGGYCIYKYGPDGRRLWARRYGTTVNGFGAEFVWRLIWTNGSLVAAGVTGGAYGGPKPLLAAAFLAKIDPATGAEQHVGRIARNGLLTIPWGLTADDAGHLYVSGGTTEEHPLPPVQAPFVAKVRFSDLETLWFDVPEGGRGELISAEGLGGVTYIPTSTPGKGTLAASGYTTIGNFLGATGPTNDVFLIRYDDTGRYLGGSAFGVSDRHEGPWQTTHDSQGNIYVVGATQGGLDGQPYKGGGDGFVRKMDRNGKLLWTRLIGTPRSDTVHSLQIVDNTLYLAGDTMGDLAAPNRGLVDIWVGKMDTNGKLLTTRQFGSDEVDNNFDIEVQGDTVYVGGHTAGSLVEPFGGPGGLDSFLTALRTSDLTFKPTPTPNR